MSCKFGLYIDVMKLQEHSLSFKDITKSVADMQSISVCKMQKTELFNLVGMDLADINVPQNFPLTMTEVLNIGN